MVRRPRIASSDIIRALQRLVKWGEELSLLDSKYGLKTQDLNHMLSVRLEQCIEYVLRPRYPDVTQFGGPGKPDLLFPSFDDYVEEIKVTSHGAGKSAVIQIDVTSWESGQKDIILFIREEGTIDNWMVTRYLADRAWFEDAGPKSRGKARMVSELRWEGEDIIGTMGVGPRGGINPIFQKIRPAGFLEEFYDEDLDCYITVIEDRHEDWNSSGIDEARTQGPLASDKDSID